MIHTIAQKTADIFCRQNVADEEKKENLYLWHRTFGFKPDRCGADSGDKYRDRKNMEWSSVSFGIYTGTPVYRWIPCRYLCALQRRICTDLSVDCRHMDILQSA